MTGNLNFGFMIGDGSKTLRISAVTAGPVFEAADAYYGHNGHGRFAYHAFGKSQYNLSTHVSQFLDASKGVSQVKFKAMIANDMFYVWFWYGDEQPTLAWKIPLTEQLYGPNGAAWTGGSPFMGFGVGSAFTMNMRIRGGADAAISNLTVKTGAGVDTSVLSAN